MEFSKKSFFYSLIAAICASSSASADQQILDDLIVAGSASIGQDSVNGESFGFDTLRLKENNLRIHFQDTSNTGSFPSSDWRIVINDSGNGGQNYFAIEDSDAGTIPFRVRSGAGNHALYVDQQGDVGLGTSNPIVELHIANGDTPTVRLEQDGSSGFTPQTWDIAGNESNFFVRDSTNGSQLSFRIEPGADEDTLRLNSDNSVGIGTRTKIGDGSLNVDKVINAGVGIGIKDSTPDGDLDVENNAANSVVAYPTASNSALEVTTTGDDSSNNPVGSLLVLKRDTTATTGSLLLNTDADDLVIRSDSNAGISILSPTSATAAIYFGDSTSNSSGGMVYARNPFAGDSMTLRVGGLNHWVLNPNGSLTTSTGASLSTGGAWVDASSRELKQDIRDLSPQEALDVLKEIRPVEFAYKKEPAERKVGFIAEDVPDLVATNNRKGLSSMDIVGVVTKVVQQQQRMVEQQEATIAELKSRLSELESLIQSKK